MFLGLHKPIKKEKKYLKQKNNVSKKLFNVWLWHSSVEQNKRYLTIAFTVLEEIYFSLAAEKAHNTQWWKL